MSLQKFQTATAQKITQLIRAELILPASEQQPVDMFDLDSEDLPEPTSLSELGDLFRVGGIPDETIVAPNAQGRWFLSTVDPAAAIAKLPGLAVAPGWCLVIYLYRQARAGMGATWAIPESFSTTAFLEAALRDTSAEQIPRPEAAKPVMEALTGNFSVASFLAASLLYREIKEIGRFGKLAHWSRHRLIGAIPPNQPWQWRGKAPQDLAPKVRVLPDQPAAVEFFTCRLTPPVSLFRHVDQYAAGSYRLKSTDQSIALIPPKLPSQRR
ncbi:MAG: hypothetical protein HC886_05430 [Leptolyngbyaceae cyanobacterium SM1_1_3]|nr:hypothetical protein [Leptolyngbyaceae cyanobacterium SM1_1_3]NJN03710.1 hypothetical protein [Leptolyngbyaceae cyanobacterium RM1_1_2]NJO09337.1 hypothetical protein [Leptolyngbyaceae cyanobacterium SL_1_1]